jgi:hypothetical protein
MATKFLTNTGNRLTAYSLNSSIGFVRIVSPSPIASAF